MGRLIAYEELGAVSEELRRAGKRIVLTNGHFDLLHIGHVRYLEAARQLGDALIVAVNDDASTRLRKGPTRPIVPASERAELVAALSSVDYVTIFPGETAEKVVERVRPHFYVKGGDYALSDEEVSSGKYPLPEAPLVRSLGGEIVLLPLVPEHSTTALVERILRLHGCLEDPGKDS